LLKLCICDDLPEDLATIRALTERFAQTHQDHRIDLTAFQSPFALLDHLEKSNGFDLYLLDMLMPHMTGLELARRIRERGEPAQILFLTISREYAVEAFGVRAAGYLMKPVSQEAFDRAVLEAIADLAPRENPALLLKTREGLYRAPLKSIVCIESFNHSRECTLADGKVVETSDTLSSLLERLGDDPRFFSPHRAYIINLDYVNGIKGNEVLLPNGVRMPVARKLLPALKDAYVKCHF